MENTTEIQALPKTKKKNGYMYTLIERTDKAAFYSMRNIKYKEDTSIGYEVFKIVHTPAYSMNGYDYPAAEKFAGNEDGGKTLWCFNKFQSAKAKFEELR